MDKATPIAYVCSGLCCLIGQLTAQDVAAWGGLAFAGGTFVVNWIYKHRDDRRAERAARAVAREAAARRR